MFGGQAARPAHPGRAVCCVRTRPSSRCTRFSLAKDAPRSRSSLRRTAITRAARSRTLTITARQTRRGPRSWPPVRSACTSWRTARSIRRSRRSSVLGPEHRLALDLIPWETRAADDLNATTTGPPAVRILDAHTGCRPRAGPRARGVCHRPHPDRHRAAADGRSGPAWQRHAVHLGGHVTHAVVSPAVPDRRMAAAAPAQPTARARPLLRPRRHPDRETASWSRPTARRRC